ncbi:MAG: hypothetical protein WC130_03850 [Kiritimatiellia bacterium]
MDYFDLKTNNFLSRAKLKAAFPHISIPAGQDPAPEWLVKNRIALVRNGAIPATGPNQKLVQDQARAEKQAEGHFIIHREYRVVPMTAEEQAERTAARARKMEPDPIMVRLAAIEARLAAIDAPVTAEDLAAARDRLLAEKLAASAESGDPEEAGIKRK